MCISSLSQYRLNRLQNTPITKLVPKSIVDNPEAVERFSWAKWYDSNAVDLVTAKAVTRRACISYKTQRAAKIRMIPYKVEVYQNLTVIQQVHHRLVSRQPPARTDKPVITFTKRSRNSLMNKFRKMRRQSEAYTRLKNIGSKFPEEVVKSGYELELPLFVTLTYHENFTDTVTAKKHLNAWFQRLRRIYGHDFRYFWKMEFQRRGAIHFHLALYINPAKLPIVPGLKKGFTNLDRAKKYVGQSWAEITAAVNGFAAPASKLGNYTVKSYYVTGRAQDIKTGKYVNRRNYIKRFNCAGYYQHENPGIWHKNYGTNVRECKNWKMAAGYMSKYLGKETDYLIDRETGEIKETGRFWGFSNNFNFSAFFKGVTNETDLKKLQELANNVNEAWFNEYEKQVHGNIEREKQGKNRRGKIQKIQKSLIRQRSRYKINQFKIWNHEIEWWHLVKKGVFKASYKDFYRDDINPDESSPGNLQFEVDSKSTIEAIKKANIMLLDPIEFENIHGANSIDIDINELY